LAEKPEGNRPLGKPRYRWEDIKTDLTETGRVGTGLICLRINISGWLL
jgi:hypothetical protein